MRLGLAEKRDQLRIASKELLGAGAQLAKLPKTPRPD